MYMKYYVYHVTNPEEVILGGKPNVEEKGPYSYLVKRSKVDIANGEGLGLLEKVQFGEEKTYFFDDETSCVGCSKDDIVTVINAPLIGFVYQFVTIGGILEAYASRFNSAMKNEKFVLASRCNNYQTDENGDYYNPQWIDSLFMDVIVDDLIFNGIKPGVLQLTFDCFNASLGTLYPPKLIQYDTGFAFMNKRNDSAYYEYYSMHTGFSDLGNYNQLDKWGPLPGVLYDDLTPAKWWQSNGGYDGSNACNLLKGSNGLQFPPGVTDKDKLYVFNTDVCRSLFTIHQSDIDDDGIFAKRFYVPMEAFQLNTTSNIGFCMEYEKDVPWNECLDNTEDPDVLDISKCIEHPEYSGRCKDGILDITKCMGDTPLIISAPHFYQAPLELNEAIDGMNSPKQETDETTYDIEPHLGITVRIRRRLQFNTRLMPYDRIDVLNNVQETIFPIFWFEESADIQPEQTEKLGKILVRPLKMAEIGQWVVFGIAFILTVIGVGLMVFKGDPTEPPNPSKSLKF